MKDKDFKLALKDVLDAGEKMLNERRENHGNAIMNPINVFFKGTLDDKFRCLLDMKLERIRDARTEASLNDSILDLWGYLTLWQVARKEQDQAGPETRVGPALYRVDSTGS